VLADLPLEKRPMAQLALGRPSFPIRAGKIQRPRLPVETLRRDRLLDWLGSQADRRVINVVAEAGFGKTTLVADFVRQFRLRSFWYRLDEGDTDGLVFLRYLIAACQAVDPRLLAHSAAVLAEAQVETMRAESILDTVLAEIDCLAEVPSALVLDDVQAIELVPSIRQIIDRLIGRAPTGLKVILISRRPPPLALALLRARGEVAELTREQLRFNEPEIGRLFAESYGQPLETGVLHDLQARTEGWAASLSLVRAAVMGRSPAAVKAFIGSLTGAEGDLYDFLAEEVVTDLDPELRACLTRVVLLDEIEPESAAIAATVSAGQARSMIAEAQRRGLLSQGDAEGGSWRTHPLVHDFLLKHLEDEVGETGIAELHGRLARRFEPQSWRLAANHWASAGKPAEVRRVICTAVPIILSTGDLGSATALMARFPDPNPNPWYDIIRSRQLADDGRFPEALSCAQAAASRAATSPDEALVTYSALALMTAATACAQLDSIEMARSLMAGTGDPELAAIGKTYDLMDEAVHGGSLDESWSSLQDLLRLTGERGHTRFEAMTLFNLSDLERVRGNSIAALEAAEGAVQKTEAAGSVRDIKAARLKLAKALAYAGRWEEARSQIASVFEDEQAFVEPEVVGEAAELEALYGDPARGSLILARAFDEANPERRNPYCRVVASRLALLDGHPENAARLRSPSNPEEDAAVCFFAFESACNSLDLQIRATSSPDDASLLPDMETAIAFAEDQQAWFWSRTIGLTRALVSPAKELVATLLSLAPNDLVYLSIQAELVVRRLGDLDEACLAIVHTEALLRRERWRWALRKMLADSNSRPAAIKRGAALLELVGDAVDVPLLRSIAQRKSLGISDAGRILIHRLAPSIYIEDLGRVTIRVGGRVIPGTDVRRKALALLVYLLAQPKFTASREQAADALWPELAPEAATNSLDQTAHMLRRSFEPEANSQTSAGYLNIRGDLVWLDADLVKSRSSECLTLIEATQDDPSPELVAKLAETYTGRFAADFIYEDWAGPFRDTLHAGFLDRIEQAILADTKCGIFDRAIATAQRALTGDPEADQIELCLIRLYRLTGADAAAHDRYQHYAAMMREQLGVEPLPLESL
jgi:ATP/maltotriose-dependent transcriptional regulator MalT/DNA-binding SARP family transcriptional activator